MVRVIKSQKPGSFTDVVSVHQQVLALVDHIGVNVVDGGPARSLMNQIAEIARRIGQFRSTICHGGQPLLQLPAFQKIAFKQGVETLENIVRKIDVRRKLTKVNAVAVIQYESEAGAGLKDYDYDQILNAICNSI